MMNLHPESHEPNAARRWFTFIACGALCVVVFAAGVYFSDVMDRRVGDVYPVVDDEEVVEGEEVVENTAPVEFVSTDEDLAIDWIDPTQQSSAADDVAFGEAVCYDEFDGEQVNNCAESPADIIRWSYKLGTVSGGTYDGRELVMTTVPVAGMGTYYQSFYFLRDPNNVEKPVLMDKLFRETGDWYIGINLTMTASEALGDRVNHLSGYQVETEATVHDLGIEESLIDSTGHYVFTGYWVRLYSDLAISLTGAREATSWNDIDPTTLYLYEPKVDANGQLLEGQTGVGRNQFYTVGEDGLVRFYDLEVPFFTYDTDKTGLVTSYGLGTPDVRWNDGSTNTSTYFKGAVGGCGFTTTTNVISQEKIDTLGLTQAGVGVADGVEYDVFEPSSYDVDYYDDAFTIVTWEQEEAKTYADFSHPFFYFQDSFGRWIEFMSNEIVPPAECGKPVIYLYPEQTIDVSVFVKPRGGFSYTEPEYNDGWNVTAYPDGHLVNRADGVEYPYLFWEGRGGLYSAPASYWVVAKSGVESFLRETLSKMNLTQNESDDFVEFWLPRMQSAPYYKIGFHDTRVMDALAPLSLSVKPDNVFRILMDYSELQAAEASKPPARLPRANRNGFEVIEWGGVIR